MIKVSISIILGISSIFFLIYTIYKNQPNLDGKILNIIYMPQEKKTMLAIYTLITNTSQLDNTAISYKVSIFINNKYLETQLYYGFELDSSLNYMSVISPENKILFMPQIKEKLLYKMDLPIKPGRKIDGYLFCFLDSSIKYKDIKIVKVEVTDVFFNKFIIENSTKEMDDILLFLQLSNAKTYNQDEKQFLKNAIENYSPKDTN